MAGGERYAEKSNGTDFYIYTSHYFSLYYNLSAFVGILCFFEQDTADGQNFSHSGWIYGGTDCVFVYRV